MIHMTVGKLGSGKGVLVMRRIEEELAHGFRDIVTNVPLRLDPWVNGSGQPQMGLLAYLKLKYGDDCNARERILVVDDPAELGDLFLWRRTEDGFGDKIPEGIVWRDPAAASVTGRGWFKLPVLTDGKGKAVAFNAEPIKQGRTLPCLVITDEAWQCYPARDWQGIPVVMQFYGRQQRKLRDEWFIVTQHHKDVDGIIHRICQDFTVCRNHGMERMGFFRQPDMLHTYTYTQPPDKSSKVMNEGIYRVDIKGLAQCYDTSAGVGVAGGFAADHGQKKRGLHWAWLVLAVFLLVGAVAALPMGLGRIASRWIGHVSGGSALRPHASTNSPSLPAARPAAVPSVVPGGAGGGPVSVVRPGVAQGVWVTGRCKLPGRPLQIVLSDGRWLREGDPNLTVIAEDWILYAGVKYDWRPQASPPAAPEARPDVIRPDVMRLGQL